MTKIIRVKIGEVYIEGKSYGVFQNAFEQKAKDGSTYHVIKHPVFTNTIKGGDEE